MALRFIAVLAALVCAAHAGSLYKLKTFQQNDANGYSAQREVSISTQYSASYNCFNGVAYAHVPSTGYQVIGGWMTTGIYTPDSFRPLIRWDNLDQYVPTNAIVSSASVTVRLQQWNNLGQCPVNIKVLTKTWSYNLTDTNGCHRIGWVDSDKSNQWTTPGALDDTVAGATSIVSATVSSGSGQLLTATLNTAAIQSWVSTPSTNNGLIFFVPTDNVPSCNTQLQAYPVLSINFTCPDGYAYNDATSTCDALTCTFSDANSLLGSYSATVGGSVSVQCNSGFIGGGNAVCQPGSGPTVKISVPRCVRQVCNLNVHNSVEGAYEAAFGSSVTVACAAGYTGGGVASCVAGSGNSVDWDNTPYCA